MTEKNTNSSDDVYISILKLGKKNGVKGVAYDELYENLHNEKYITVTEREQLKNSAREVRYLKQSIDKLLEESCPSTTERTSGVRARVMSMDSYFKLLEHEELIEVKNSSNSARKFSIIAIAIAFISLFVSLLFGFKPTTINESQIDRIIKSISLSFNVTKTSDKTILHQTPSYPLPKESPGLSSHITKKP